MDNYPVYIEGKECGRLTVSTDGLMTVFRAKCSVPGGKIIRLYLNGESSALFGTLDKRGELMRRVSRVQLQRFPQSIKYASDRQLVRQNSNEGDTLWHRGKMGCLVSTHLIAIPAADGHLSRVSDKLRRIDGKLYLIFERKM